jgi:uncharacterized protein YbjT (DUF2867 family)
MPIAFVAGATGYTGQEVVRELCGKGIRCVAHVRLDSPRLAEWQRRFRELGAEPDATPWDESAMEARLRELSPTHVFALLGTTRARGKRAAQDGQSETYDSVDYGLTALLVRATTRAAPDARFVYLSSASVSDATSNAYLHARWRVEQELAKSGLGFVVARPSFITGDDREESRPLERVAAGAVDAALGIASVLGAKRFAARYGSTDAQTLARALVRHAFADGPRARTIHSEELR